MCKPSQGFQSWEDPAVWWSHSRLSFPACWFLEAHGQVKFHLEVKVGSDWEVMKCFYLLVKPTIKHLTKTSSAVTHAKITKSSEKSFSILKNTHPKELLVWTFCLAFRITFWWNSSQLYVTAALAEREGRRRENKRRKPVPNNLTFLPWDS